VTAVVVVLAIVVVALAAALIVSNRQLLASNAELVKAVIAKDGRELAHMNRVERRPAPAPAPESTVPVSPAELFARIQQDIEAVEGRPQAGQPVGFDGT